jgi:hypothetical protein
MEAEDVAEDIETRSCPYCCEDIHPQAIKCKHCSSDLSAEPSSTEKPVPAERGEEKGSTPVRLVTPETKGAAKGALQEDEMLGHGIAGLVLAVISLFLFVVAYGAHPMRLDDYEVAFTVAFLSSLGIVPWMIYVITRPGAIKWLPGISLVIVGVMMLVITSDPSSPFFVR